MAPDHPEIAGPSYRFDRRLGDLLFRLSRGRFIRRRFGGGEERLQLVVGEADHLQIEVTGLEFGQFAPQDLIIPTSALGEPVIGDYQRAPLEFGQVREHNHRHLGHPKLARRQNPGMPGDDHVIGAHQDRVCPAKLPDGGRHLGDLLLGVGAGVARKRQQLGEPPEFDLCGNIHQINRMG